MTSQRSIPRYQNVKNYILQGIANNHWRPSERLPSENELVSICSVSRMTARKALIELTHEGILKRVKGLGTFINPNRMSSSLLEIRDIAEEINARDHQHHCRIISLEYRKHSEYLLLQGLDIEKSECFYSQIVHFENSIPIQLEIRRINPDIAPDYLNQNFRQMTTANYLMMIAPVSKVEHEVKAMKSDQELGHLLQLSPHEPCLHLHRKTWSGKQWATISDFYYPGSRYVLTA